MLDELRLRFLTGPKNLLIPGKRDKSVSVSLTLCLVRRLVSQLTHSRFVIFVEVVKSTGTILLRSLGLDRCTPHFSE